MTSCSFNEPVLKTGDTGNAVQLLQTSLHGYSVLFGPTFVHDPGPIDGGFGPKSEDSLKSFQTSLGLGPADGIAGAITWSALDMRDDRFPYGGLDLHKGDSGNPVRHLQRLLFAVASDPGSVDGIYGNQTAAAVEDFQQRQGIPKTGDADGQTRILLSFVFGQPRSAPLMTVDMYLSIPGLTDGPGAVLIDSTPYLQISDFSFGVANTDAGPGKVEFSALTVGLPVDFCTPKLFSACVRGTHFQSASLIAQTGGSSQPVTTEKYDLKDVVVRSLSVAGSASGDQQSLTLGYGALQITYTPLDAQGKAETPSTGGFDITTNTPS